MRPLLVLPLLTLLAACSAPEATPQAAAPVAVESVVLAPRAVTLTEVVPATVTAERRVTLMARVPALVARIDAVPGTRLKAGTVIADLDAAELEARARQARAQAAQAAADLDRAVALAGRQAMTPAELDAAKARAEATAAAASEAAVLTGYTRLTAPFDALVIQRHAEVGDLLAPGRPVVDLEDPASLRLDAAVPESLASQVLPGTSLAVAVPAAALAITAPVVEVSPAADPVTRTVRVRLALPATPGLRSGQFGRVTVPVAAGERLVIPAGAVRHLGQMDAVLVVEDGHARLRLVRLGDSTATGEVAVRAGLAAGERLLTSPGTVADGAPVTTR